MLRNMMGWGGVGNDVNVPSTYPHGWCYATWWGGVGWGMMLTFLELTHMVDAMQHDGVGWGMMLTFLELGHRVDATQHDGVGWSLYVFITFFLLSSGNWAASWYNKCTMGVAETCRCQNTTRLSERTSKIFEDLSQNAKTQVVSAFTKSGLSS